ncbi:hypothetical protein [Mannheimia indoligenes]|uniref:hypothetical protein n=1 Tax=Mannheimia indoligenes TaxID=3103145 RepID=UPI002FE67281
MIKLPIKNIIKNIIYFICFFFIPVLFLAFIAIISKPTLDSIIVILSLIGLILNNISQDYPKTEKHLRKIAGLFVKYIKYVFLIYGGLYFLGGLLFYFMENLSNIHLNKEQIEIIKEFSVIPIFFVGLPLIVCGIILFCLTEKVNSSKGIPYAIYFTILLLIYIAFVIRDEQFINDIQNFIKLIF